MPSAPMPSVTAIRGMLRTDTLRMRRDRFLMSISPIVFAYALGLRWLLPFITADWASDWDFDLTTYHSLIVSTFIVQGMPLLPGLIGGFLLLESREDGTVKALMVSPNPLTSYLSVVCVVMFVTAALLTLIGGATIALALPPWPALIAVALAVAPGAPMYALLLATVANNKVQAFAYMKLLGNGGLLVVGAYFLPEPWQWLTAIYPPYCASKAYWIAEAGGSNWPVWILAGLVGSAVWVVVLQRLYLRAARK